MGIGWASGERFRCIRLLGKQPLDAIGTPEIAEIFLACHVIEQQFPYAFQELRCEIHEERFKMHKRELERWTRAGLVPADATAAKAVLLRVIDQETSRLRALEADREQVARELLELESDILGFDESKAGEQLARHQDRCNRLILRNVEAVERRHRNEEQGWGRTRKERERRKAARTEEDDSGIEARPFDDRLVLTEQGAVRSVGEYVEAGLARYHMSQWGTGEPRQRRSAVSEASPPAVPDFARWAVAEEKRKTEEAERIAEAGCRAASDEYGTQQDSGAAGGGDGRAADFPVAEAECQPAEDGHGAAAEFRGAGVYDECAPDVPVMVAGKGEQANVQNENIEDQQGVPGDVLRSAECFHAGAMGSVDNVGAGEAKRSTVVPVIVMGNGEGANVQNETGERLDASWASDEGALGCHNAGACASGAG
jgi:hypothetical protein